MRHSIETFQVFTPCPSIRLVNVYDRAAGENKFSLGLPLELVPEEHLSGVYVKDETEDPGQMLIVKSKFAPEVGLFDHVAHRIGSDDPNDKSDANLAKLVVELTKLRARNLGHDHVFLGRELRVTVERRLFSPRSDDLFNSYDRRGLIDSDGQAVYLLLKQVDVSFNPQGRRAS